MGIIFKGNLVLKNVLYIPDFRYNLMSKSKLTGDLNCVILFYPKFVVFQDLYSGNPIQIGRELSGLYTCVSAVNNFVFLDSPLSVSLKPYVLWHKTLGHVSDYVFRRISSLNHISHNKNDEPCDVCPKAKQSRLPFPISNSRAYLPFDLLHVDVWGPFHIQTHDSKSLFLTIVDDFTRCTWVYLMQFKSDYVIVLKDFVSFAENHLNTTVKIIRTDNGKEFINKECSMYFAHKGI